MWEVTVVHGKQTLAVAVPAPAEDAAWLETLQQTVAERTGVAVAHQKLLFRGKQLTKTSGARLTNGAKLMLLKNANFHKQEASQKTPIQQDEKKQDDDGRKDEEPTPRMEAAAAVVVAPRRGLAASDVDEDHVLVQATRGKSVYEFLFPVDATTIATVKARVGAALGLAGDALRLILKGKTPQDDDPLASFVPSNRTPRVLKCMVLLNAKQHDLLEREEEFRVLQNELTSVERDATRLAKAMCRNLLAREEVLFRLHALQDHIGRLSSNLEILEDQLKATKLVHGSATMNALENAQQACSALQHRVEKMAQQFESRR